MSKSSSLFEEDKVGKQKPLHDHLKDYALHKVIKDKLNLTRAITKLEQSIINHNIELEQKKQQLEKFKKDLELLGKIEHFI